MWGIILGAFIALIGTIIVEILKNYYIMLQQDKQNLIKIVPLLLELSSFAEDYKRAKRMNEISPSNPNEYKLKEAETSIAELNTKISHLALLLITKKYRSISVACTQISLDKKYLDSDFLYSTTEKAQLIINKKMIKKYEKESMEAQNHLK